MMDMGSMPMGDDAGEGDESSALMDALEQIRQLCDQIEASQMQDRMKPKAPAEPDAGAPEGGE